MGGAKTSDQDTIWSLLFPLQSLCKYGEPQPTISRSPPGLLVVRKRDGLAGARVAAPLVPRDQLVADLDHLHDEARHAPVVAGDPLGLGQHRSAGSGRLPLGI